MVKHDAKDVIMASSKDIIEILQVKNVRIKNTHNNYIFPYQNIMKITFRNGETRFLDLFSRRDMTDVDYFKIITTEKTKEKIIFKESY